jgi:SAM-dependent methyltransferase
MRMAERQHGVAGSAAVLIRSLLITCVVGFSAAADPNPYVKVRPTFDPSLEATPPFIVHAMLKLAGVKPTDLVCDLGSGDGRIVITAAKSYGARALGVEFNPKTLAKAKENAKKNGVEDKTEFVLGDIYAYDVSRCTVVTLFLWPEINLKLRPKLINELAPGTAIVSHEHGMGSWKPEATQYCDNSEPRLTCSAKKAPDRTPIYKWIVTEEVKEGRFSRK